jgi:hypothetical protein
MWCADEDATSHLPTSSHAEKFRFLFAFPSNYNGLIFTGNRNYVIIILLTNYNSGIKIDNINMQKMICELL